MATSLEHKRTVIHFDIDCFYAQVEMIRNPNLRDKPLGIQQKYLLVTCNYAARRRGVTKLMSIVEAQKKCPELVIVNGEDLTHYRNMSYKISDFIQKYTPTVERLGFDVEDRIRKGGFDFKPKVLGNVFELEDEKHWKNTEESDGESLVCTCGCLVRIQIGSQIAADIRERLHQELGITCCAGIAHNKLLAKLVGSIHKPNKQTSILPHLGCQLVSSLPGIRSIPGIGSSSTKRLSARGIDSIWDLQQTTVSLLVEEFGKPMAETFLKLCFGIDDSPVLPFSLPQTLSDEDSFKCCDSLDNVENRIHQLIQSLLKRLKDDIRIPSTLRLTTRGKYYVRNSRQCPIPVGLFKEFDKVDGLEMTASRLMPLLLNLFRKLVDVSRPFHLPLINVCFAKLFEPNAKQNTLDSYFTGSRSLSATSSSINNKKCGVEIEIEKNVDGSQMDQNNDVYENENEIVEEDEGKTKNLLSKLNCEPQNVGNESKLLNTEIEMRSSCALPLPSTSFSSTIVSNDVPLEEIQKQPFSQLDDNNHFFASVRPNPEVISNNSEEINNNSSFENLKQVLPKHIDASELLHQLPDDIQNEVLSSFGIIVKILNNGKRIYTLENKVSTRQQKRQEDKNQGAILPSCRKPLFSPKKRNAPDNQDIIPDLSGAKSRRVAKFENTDLLDVSINNGGDVSIEECKLDVDDVKGEHFNLNNSDVTHLCDDTVISKSSGRLSDTVKVCSVSLHSEVCEDVKDFSQSFSDASLLPGAKANQNTQVKITPSSSSSSNQIGVSANSSSEHSQLYI